MTRAPWSTVLAAALLAAGALAGAAAAKGPDGSGDHGNKGNSGPAHVKAETHATRNGGSGSGEGIVQSVSSTALVLKELDGSTLTVSVDPATRVVVDGKPATLREVKPGSVAVVNPRGKGGQQVQVFTAGVTVVASVSDSTVTVTQPSGSTAAIAVGPRTRVLVDGTPASLHDVQPGYILVTDPKAIRGKKPAGELAFLRPV